MIFPGGWLYFEKANVSNFFSITGLESLSLCRETNTYHPMEAEPGSRKLLLTLLVFSLFPFFGQANTTAEAALDAQVDHLMSLVEDDVKERLAAMDQPLLEHRYDAAVRNMLKRYLRYPEHTGLLIGRAMIYFPIFEQHLKAAGLPEALKYLPIVESSLRTDALSRVGALGLWQFMPGTALEFGLQINEYVDERMDPHRATEAAVQYLIDAYEYFEDWSLAIAAYNAGKGGVRRAQRRSRGKTFWGVKRNLPRETRSYVPRFIAATYLAEFYALHDISPRLPALDLQLTEAIKVYQPLSFYRIAQVTELPIAVIERLNPAYPKGYIPAYHKGHYLTLPSRVMPAMRQYIDQYGQAEDEPLLPWAPILQLPERSPSDTDYQSFSHPMAPTDSLSGIAQQLHLPAYQLAVWNAISPLDSIREQRWISYYRPADFLQLPSRDVGEKPSSLPLALADHLQPQSVGPRALPPVYQYQLPLYVQSREKPSVIARRFAHIDLRELLALNNLNHDRPLPVGTTIWISRPGK